MTAALAIKEENYAVEAGQDRRFAAEESGGMRRPRRVLAYARVSSAVQALGTSLRDQQEAIRAYAASRGLSVTRFYVEAESAVHEKIERREQMRQLLKDARKGDLIVCDKLDRWSRDPAFTHTTVRDLLAMGAGFYAVSERCDPSTSEGDTALGFRVLFAREEHKRIKERMVGTRNILRDQGYYVEGTPPLGYRRAHPRGHKGLEKNVLVIVPDEAELVRKIFRSYVAGRSMTRLAGDLGLKLDRVKDAIHRRVYIGQIENSRGEWIQGRHPAIIGVDLFARAQQVCESRKLGGARPRDAVSETSTWILRDVARCGRCSAKMSAAYAGPKGPGRRYYYACSKRCASTGGRGRANNGAHVPVRDVEAAFEPMVLERLAELREGLSSGPDEEGSPDVSDFAERRTKLDQKRARILDAYEAGDYERDEMRKRLAKVDAARLKLDAEEAAATRPNVLASAPVRRALLRELATIRKAWRSATPATRREIVSLLVTAVAVRAGYAPIPEWRSAEDLAEEVRS